MTRFVHFKLIIEQGGVLLIRLSLAFCSLGIIILVALGLFGLLFNIGFLQNIDVVFYRGLFISFFIGMIFFCISLVFIRLKSNRNPAFLAEFYAMVLAAFIVVFLGFFHLMLPVSLDRSISVFMLASIDGASGGLDKNEIEKKFSDIYVDAYDAFGRRVAEQLETGNIEHINGKYILTKQGKRFLYLSRFIVSVLNLDPKYVNPVEQSSRGGG